MPNPLLKQTDLPIGPKGHLEANTRLQVATGVEAGTDQIGEVVEGAWGAGDSTQVPDTTDFPLPYCTPSAQHAVRQAAILADNVYRQHVGRELQPYKHKYIGSVAGLGLYKGVANTYGFKAKGLLAWLMHRGYHLSRVPGSAARAASWPTGSSGSSPSARWCSSARSKPAGNRSRPSPQAPIRSGPRSPPSNRYSWSTTGDHPWCSRLCEVENWCP
ncbi:hypothetical protein GCM10029992_02390 [Glycomyces albus]